MFSNKELEIINATRRVLNPTLWYKSSLTVMIIMGKTDKSNSCNFWKNEGMEIKKESKIKVK
jgi:hypothetical protein